MLFNQLKEVGGRLFVQAGIHMLVGFIGPFLAFLFIPIFVRVLSPEDYGMASMFAVLCGILVSFVGLSSHGAMARKYIEKESVDFPAHPALDILKKRVFSAEQWMEIFHLAKLGGLGVLVLPLSKKTVQFCEASAGNLIDMYGGQAVYFCDIV